MSQPRTESLDVRGSVFGVYQSASVSAEPVAPVNPRLQGGTFGGATGMTTYERRTDRAHFGINGSASVWEYTASSERTTVAGSASTEVALNLGPNFVLNASGGASYSPFYQFSPMLFDGGTQSGTSGVSNGGILAPGFPLAAITESHIDLNTAAGVTRNISKRSSVSGAVEWRQWRFLANEPNNQATWEAHVRFNHRLTKALGAHAGYARQVAREGVSGVEPLLRGTPFLNETIDLGLDYGDSLTFARRVFVSFGGSTSAIRFQNDTRYRFNGRASIARGLARTWSASVGYARDTEVTAGFHAPLLTDSVNGWLGGLLAPRARWGMGGAYSRGTVGFDALEPFQTAVATTRLEIALMRRMGVTTQYAYHRYRLPKNSSWLGLLDRSSHQVVTVGLTLWMPIISDTRGPRDPR